MLVGDGSVYQGTITGVAAVGNIVTISNIRSSNSTIATTARFNLEITPSVLSRLGGTFTGAVEFAGAASGQTPTHDENFATKAYVDQSVAGAGGSLPVPQDTMYIELSDDTTPTPADATIPVNNGSGMLAAFTNKYLSLIHI